MWEQVIPSLYAEMALSNVYRGFCIQDLVSSSLNSLCGAGKTSFHKGYRLVCTGGWWQSPKQSSVSWAPWGIHTAEEARGFTRGGDCSCPEPGCLICPAHTTSTAKQRLSTQPANCGLQSLHKLDASLDGHCSVDAGTVTPSREPFSPFRFTKTKRTLYLWKEPIGQTLPWDVGAGALGSGIITKDEMLTYVLLTLVAVWL